VKIAKRLIRARKTSLPRLRFDDQKLTSFSGLLVFQKFFSDIQIDRTLNRCFRSHDNSSAYGLPKVFKLLVIHVILGFQRLRDVEFYKDDPMVLSTVGIRKAPNVSTIARTLADVDGESVERLHETIRENIVALLEQCGVTRVTLDFDGSVLGTNRHAEGAAAGFNRKKKGQRSYYPLFCTVAQTGQILDVLHRSGNVHDSNGAVDFVVQCVEAIRNRLPQVAIETRMDSAFFSDLMADTLESLGVDYTISVPFERFCVLKEMIAERRFWRSTSSGEKALKYFEKKWCPESWEKTRRFLFVRSPSPVQRKGPLQLELFEPIEFEFEYKVVLTNKRTSARNVVRFHEGRGQQENVFSDLKSQGSLGYVPCRKWNANKAFLLANVFAHNLTRALQVQVGRPGRNLNEKRAPLWIFEQWHTLRKNFIQRAGRLTKPGGVQTLSVADNVKVREYFERYLAA